MIHLSNPDFSMLSNYYLMKVYKEAGLPEGVINFVPSDPLAFSEHVIGNKELAGVHFTGSTPVFQQIWKNGKKYLTFLTYNI
jgi:1-pyrroline-5-carboxylate dehydrogenase